MTFFSRPLPIDVIAMIIDYFEEDGEALRKLAIVAKSWVYPARVYLFRILRVLISQDHDGLAEFRRFLDTPRGKRHAGHVVGFCARGVEPEDEYHWEPTIDLFALGEVVRHLPKLEKFVADRVRFSGVPLQGPLPSVAPKVDQLSLARMTTWVYDDLKDCLDVLHVFPNVKRILTDDLSRRMKETGVRYYGELPTSHRKFQPQRLQDLHHIAYGPASPLLHYMLHSMDLRNFTSLTLFHLTWEEIPYLGKFVHAVKDTLRYLYFNTTNVQFIEGKEPGPEEIWATLKLDECTALETLAIYVNIDFCPWKPRPPFELHAYWEYIEIIFEHLPPCLRRVELGLEDGEEPEWIEEVLLDVDWRHIERMLRGLPNLEKVTFHTYSPCLVLEQYVNVKCPLEDWMQDILREKLPVLLTKNLLDFMEPRPSRNAPAH